MNLYDHTVTDNTGAPVELSRYAGEVLLIVNTATRCGLTPQYTALQELYDTYHVRGFEILDFPSNQFLGQAPGTDEEIAEFCSVNYSTTFPRFAKIDVNGKNAAPLFTYLKAAARAEREDEDAKGLKKVLADLGQKFSGDDIKWNFTKFLVDRNGTVVERFGPTYKPADIAARVEELLG